MLRVVMELSVEEVPATIPPILEPWIRSKVLFKVTLDQQLVSVLGPPI
jgi:hypothetical protein